jgi:hypothetical protein
MSQPSGNLNGATVEFSTPLSGTVIVSNGIIQYTGSGSPGSLGSGSNLENIELKCPSGQSLDLSNAGNITINQCTLNCGLTANALGNNVTITKNIIQNSGWTGIFADPPGSNFVVTDNKIICDGVKCHEPIHLVNGYMTGMVISYNELVGMCRWGIEVQCQTQNAVCQGNKIYGWTNNIGDSNQDAGKAKNAITDQGDSHGGISWACGPSTNPPTSSTTYSNGCLLDSNVILMDGDAYMPLQVDYSQNQAIEFMGNNGTVSNNYAYNCGFCAYTFSNGFVSKNNKWIGFKIIAQRGGTTIWGSEGGTTPPTVENDEVLPFVAENELTIPTGGTRFTPGYNGGTPIPPTNNVTVSATNNGGGLATFVASSDPSNGSAAPIFTLTPPGNTEIAKTFTLTPKETSVQIQSIPANWDVIGQFAWGSTLSQASTAIQVLGGPASPTPDSDWAPTVVGVNPIPATKTVVSVTISFSDGTTTVINVQ